MVRAIDGTKGVHGAVLRAQQAVSFSTVGGLRLIKCRRASNAVERPDGVLWRVLGQARKGQTTTRKKRYHGVEGPRDLSQ